MLCSVPSLAAAKNLTLIFPWDLLQRAPGGHLLFHRLGLLGNGISSAVQWCHQWCCAQGCTLLLCCACSSTRFPHPCHGAHRHPFLTTHPQPPAQHCSSSRSTGCGAAFSSGKDVTGVIGSLWQRDCVCKSACPLYAQNECSCTRRCQHLCSVLLPLEPMTIDETFKRQLFLV